MKNKKIIIQILISLSIFLFILSIPNFASAIDITVDYNTIKGTNNLHYGVHVPQGQSSNDRFMSAAMTSSVFQNKIAPLNLDTIRVQLGTIFDDNLLLTSWNPSTGYNYTWTWTTYNKMLDSIIGLGATPVLCLPVGTFGGANYLPGLETAGLANTSLVVWTDISDGAGSCKNGYFPTVAAYEKLVEDITKYTKTYLASKGYTGNVYWEIGNEPTVYKSTWCGVAGRGETQRAAYVPLLLAAANKINSINPGKFLVSSDRFAFKFFTEYLANQSNSTSPIGFLSMHSYDVYNRSDTAADRDSIMNRLYDLNYDSDELSPQEIITKWKNATGKKLDLICTESNMDAAGTDTLMTKLFGAAWHAAKMKVFIEEGGIKYIDFFKLMEYNSASNLVMIKDSSAYEPYSQYWSSYLLAQYIPTGSEIYSDNLNIPYDKISDVNAYPLDILAVKTPISPASYNILLVNKTSSSKDASLTISGLTGVTSAKLHYLNSTTYTTYNAIPNGLGHTNITPSDTTYKLTLAGYTVAVLELNTGSSSSSCGDGSCDTATENSTNCCADCPKYGAPTKLDGSPIGGGAGYIKTYSESDARHNGVYNPSFVVDTVAELRSALAAAVSGDVIYIKDGATITFRTTDIYTGDEIFTVPEGVTIAGGRGRAGATPGILERQAGDAAYELRKDRFFYPNKNSRFIGLIIKGNQMGPATDRYWEAIWPCQDNVEIANCEIYGWSQAIGVEGENVWIHHNYIHDNDTDGYGYGVNNICNINNTSSAIIEGNHFATCRHMITGGMGRCSWIARYNYVDGFVTAATSSTFDQHGDDDQIPWDRSKYCAGENISIYNNTSKYTSEYFINIRGYPCDGGWIYVNNNWSYNGGNAIIEQMKLSKGYTANLSNNLWVQMTVSDNWWGTTPPPSTCSSPSCAGSGLSVPVLTPASPQANTAFQISCPANNTGYDCIDAYANNNSNKCTFSAWSGNNAIFNCAGLAAGTYTAKCVSKTGTSSNCCASEKTATFTVAFSASSCDAEWKSSWQLYWDGYTWDVDNTNSVSTNSNAKNSRISNVVLDTSDCSLRLKLQPCDSTIYCGIQMYTETTTKNGIYQWQIEGRPDLQDDDIVLGLYQYPSDGVNNEWDFEYAQWNIANRAWNLDLTVNPSSSSSVGRAFKGLWVTLPTSGLSTHRLTRTSTSMKFEIFNGLVDINSTGIVLNTCKHNKTDTSTVPCSWYYAPSDISLIPEQAMKTYMNYWQYDKTVSLSITPQDVIIRRFDFVPQFIPSGNQPPVLNGIGNKIVTAGDSISFTLLATDPDSDPLTYSASSLPFGSVFNQSTGVFSWTPTSGQAGGTYDIYFEVSDDGNPKLTDSEAITIAVTSIPDTTAPVITFSSPQQNRVFSSTTTLVTISLATNENTVCKYSTASDPYDSMPNTFSDTGASHLTTITVSAGNAYDYHIKCADTAGNKSNDYQISFSVKAPLPPGSGIQEGENPSANQGLRDIIDKIVDFLLIVGIILIPILVLYAAYLFISSGGNPEQLILAKKLIVWALVGSGILLSAKAILAVIWKILEGNIFGP